MSDSRSSMSDQVSRECPTAEARCRTRCRANVRQQKLNVGPGVARMSDSRSYMSDRSANVGQKVTPAFKWPNHLNVGTEASGGPPVSRGAIWDRRSCVCVSNGRVALLRRAIFENCKSSLYPGVDGTGPARIPKGGGKGSLSDFCFGKPPPPRWGRPCGSNRKRSGKPPPPQPGLLDSLSHLRGPPASLVPSTPG